MLRVKTAYAYESLPFQLSIAALIVFGFAPRLAHAQF